MSADNDNYHRDKKNKRKKNIPNREGGVHSHETAMRMKREIWRNVLWLTVTLVGNAQRRIEERKKARYG